MSLSLLCQSFRDSPETIAQPESGGGAVQEEESRLFYGVCLDQNGRRIKTSSSSSAIDIDQRCVEGAKESPAALQESFQATEEAEAAIAATAKTSSLSPLLPKKGQKQGKDGP
uniref:Uncharacterized protein n=1 Tax=Pseudo-nitzschia australis TaxID=44445 RepID=A0A7S4EPA4_9STRA|mmetsp:Transcript_24805/g.52453  ORF Transcript_24805/g.52453 Transcript_24805/m.52453 type:complete len:113 (-) Transcript_24805:785-1123(-)